MAEVDVSIIGVRDVGSLVLGIPTGNDGAVPLIDSQVGVASSVVVFKALNWLIVLREGKRGFVPGVNPHALFPSLMVRKGEGVHNITLYNPNLRELHNIKTQL